MTAILCQGLDGAVPEEVMDVPQDFVPKIVGGQLVRVRSQTVYYILTRMKSVCKVWLNRERAGANFGGRAGCRV
jgi:cysteine desulfuration protein SufE